MRRRLAGWALAAAMVVQIGGEPGVAGGAWHVLYDAGASTPLTVADWAAADAWVQAQPMSDCAGS